MTTRVQGPDGAIVEFPDGTSSEVMQSAMQAHYGAPSNVASGVGSQATQGDALYGNGSTAPRSADESLFQKVNDFGNDLGDATLHNLGNLPVGVAQLAAHGVGALANAGASTAAPGSIGAKIAGYVGDKVNALDNSIANREATYQAAVPTNTASVIGATVGNALPFLVGGEVTAAPKAATLLGKIGIGAATGGGIAATQPVTSGAQQGQMAQQITGDQTPSFAKQKVEQILGGAVTGGALPAIGAIPGKLIGSVSPEVQALAQKAQNYGIDLTGPQISKSVPLKVANNTTASIPFSGATAFAEKQQGQFNNAVAQTIGLPQGTTKITPDVFAQAKQTIGQGYDALAARNNLTINPPLVSRIQSILGEAHTDGDPDAANAISKITQEIIGKASQNGSSLTGSQFQSIDSRLGRLSTGQGDKAHYAGELQDALRQSMESGMSPADAAKSQELRSQWRNVLNLTPVLTDGTGDIPPSRLLSAVANNKAGKTQLATGNRGDLGELAQIGKQFLRDPVPNSYTAVRNMNMDALKGIGAGLSGAGAGALAGAGAVPGLATAGGVMAASRMIQSGLRSRALYNALAKLPQDQQTPIRNALAYLLETQAGQGVNKLNAGQNP